MKSLTVLVLLATTLLFSGKRVHSLTGKCNSYTREKLNEGHFRCVYKDPLGIPTIGVGFNLRKSGARQRITDVGANYDNILTKRECLDNYQIKDLFDADMAEAVQCASSWLTKVWSKIGTTRQSAVADMAFNLGCSRLRLFKNMKAALEREDYTKAAAEMRNSRWCRQVKSRCDRDIDCMKSPPKSTVAPKKTTKRKHRSWFSSLYKYY